MMLDRAAALDEAARLARAGTLVVLSPRARPVEGWLARLVAPLADPAVGVSGAAVLDESALVVHAGFDLVGDSNTPLLQATAALRTCARRPPSARDADRRRRGSRELRAAARALGGAPRPRPGLVRERRRHRPVPAGAFSRPALRRWRPAAR